MIKYTVKVDGMACGMCEAHVNDAVRAAFRVKKVTSDAGKGKTVIVSETEIPEAELRQVIDKTGSTAVSISAEPYEKKGFFARFQK